VRLDIRYRCSFEYDEPVRESHNELRVIPSSDQRQQLISARVATTPHARVFSSIDYWGTRTDAFGIREPHPNLEVIADATVETRRMPLLAAAPRFEALNAGNFREQHLEYLQRSPHCDWGDGTASEAARQKDLVGQDLVSVVLAIHRRVGATLRYAPGTTYVGVPVEDVLAAGTGVCQDFAHVAVAMCRSIGIPARYVSGYLFTTSDSSGGEPDGEAVRVQTHAWFEAAVPGAGWLALDPTNSTEVGVRHVKIGHGRDYDDIQPLRGVFSGKANQTLEVSVDIRRLPAGPEAAATRARSRQGAGVASPMESQLLLAQRQQQQ
jgi:transglutaminase-like putative cysteine protease